MSFRRILSGKNKFPVFEAVFDTRNISMGSSASNQLKISLTTETYTQPLIIKWGDGSESLIYSSSDSALTHTYATSGIYTVKILSKNLFSYLQNNTGDRLKLLEIKNWGMFWLRLNCLYGCENLILNNVSDIPDLSAVSIDSSFRDCKALTVINRFNEWNFNTTASKTLTNFFSGCINLNMPLNLSFTVPVSIYGFLMNCSSFNRSVNISFSSVTDLTSLFSGCSNFNSPITLTGTSNVTTTANMFLGCTKFNQPINGFTTNSLIIATLMFAEATAFNQNITGWNMSNASGINAMFRNALAFNQDIGIWNFNKNAFFNTSFMQGKTASTLNPQYLANLYIKMAANLIGTGRTQTNKNFGAGSAKYHSSGASARAALVADGWTITDGGMI